MLSTVLIVICASFVAYLIVIIKKRHIIKHVANIPGGGFWKMIKYTFLFIMSFVKSTKSHLGAYDLASEFFASFPSIGKIWLGSICIIDIRKPEYIKIVLTSNNCTVKPNGYGLPYKTGLLAAGGHDWKRHRRALNPAFSLEKVNTFYPIFNEKAKRLCISLDALVNQEAFSIRRIIASYTLETLLKTSLRLDKNVIEDPSQLLLKSLKKDFTSFGMRSIYGDWMKNDKKCYENAKQMLKEYKALESNVDNHNKTKLLNFIEILVSEFPENEILDEIGTLMFTGFASTATTISSTLLMIAMHPDIQSKLVDEMNDVLGCCDDVTALNVHQLAYLELVIKETMRLFPVGGFLGRFATDDIKLDDKYTIPKGVSIVLRPFHIHRDPAIWGKDAHEFKPERFLPENFSQLHNYAYIPFTNGSRICIGHRYAMAIMKTVVSHILRRFNLSTPLRYDELTFQFNFILNISQSYLVSLRKRTAPVTMRNSP